MTELANRRGLTLVELVVVLALIGIMASIVAVSTRIAAARVDSFGRDGPAEVAEARREAIERRRMQGSRRILK